MKKLLLAILLTLITNSLIAGGNQSGTVISIVPHPGETFIFRLTGTHNNKPAECANDDWGMVLTSEQGKATYSAVLAALLAGKKIIVYGTGTCVGNREGVLYMIIEP